jgi:type IV pilus assembly protein PilC
LPLPTKILIGISDFLISYWLLLIIVIAGAALLLRYYISTSGGRRNFDLFLLKIPIFGHLLQLIYLIRFSRSMNTLITGGVTISGSLQVASEVVDNTIYKELITKTLAEVESGNSISSVFSQSSHIPPMVSQMLVIGEKTGKIDLVLSKISDFYTREADGITSNLMTLIEPVIIIVMGIAVAVMVAAIILPMYNMASQF